MSFKTTLIKLLGLSKRKRDLIIENGKYNLGAKPQSPDARDASFSIFSRGTPLPTSADLTKNASSIKNQGSIGSCVAHALVLCYEIELRNLTGCDFDGSELQIYYDARALEGEIPNDSGLQPRDALLVAKNKGVAPEKLWPYNISAYNDQPGALAASFEKFFRIKSFHAIYNIQAAKEELAQGHPIMLQIPVYDNFFSCDGDYGIPSGNLAGYHEITIVGYDDERIIADGTGGGFLVQNSWGTNWGQSGRAWLSYDFVTKNLPSQASLWSIRLN